MSSHRIKIKDKTVKHYRLCIVAMRAWAIKSRAAEAAGNDTIVYIDIIDLVRDVMSRTDLSDPSKNAYRSALLWHLRAQDRLTGDDQVALKLLTEWAPWKISPLKTKPKTISRADFDRLYDELMSQRGIWARRTSHWLLAGLATGLRPSEWLQAEWGDETKTSLRVQCAKTKLSPPAYLKQTASARKKNRSFGTGVTERTVPVSADFDRMVIDEHMKNIRETINMDASIQERARQFAQYQHQARTSIHRACIKIWGGRKMYSLYSLRRQFAANSKAAYGSGVTATLMGHSSPNSPSAACYGKANQSHTRSTRGPEFTGLTIKTPSQIPTQAQTNDGVGVTAPTPKNA